MALKGLKGFCGVEIVYNKGFLFGQIAKFLSMQIIFCFNLRKSSWGGSKNSNLMLTLHSVWRKRKQKVSSCRSGTCRMSDVSRCRASEKHFVVPLPRWEVTCHSGTPFSPIRAVLWRASNSRPGTQPAACARCLACPISQYRGYVVSATHPRILVQPTCCVRRTCLRCPPRRNGISQSGHCLKRGVHPLCTYAPAPGNIPRRP